MHDPRTQRGGQLAKRAFLGNPTIMFTKSGVYYSTGEELRRVEAELR